MNGDGTRVQLGWVDADEGLLVLDRNGNGIVDNTGEWFGEDFSATGATPPAGQKGFEALSTLAVSGATVFSRATARTDANGANYFDQVRVWVDRDQDGRSDEGELLSLAQLGITSIDLSRQAVDEYAAGNVILSRAGFTYADGSRGDVYDVGLSVAPLSTRVVTGPNEVSLAFAELVAAGLPALAAGQAQAAANSLGSLQPGFDAALGAIQQYMGGPRNMYWQGYPVQFIRSPDGSRIWAYGPNFNPSQGLAEGSNLVGNNAPQLTIDALNSIANLQAAGRVAAQTIASAANAMSQAQIDALAANMAPSTATETAARSSASASAVAWSNAVRDYVTAAGIAATAGNQLTVANTALAALVPTSFSYSKNLAGDFTYWSAHDARLAGAAFDGIDAGFLRFAMIKDALGEALGAFAQAGAYDNVAIGITGQTVTASGLRTLIIAGQGDQSFVAGSGQDDFLLTRLSNAVTIQGFGAGVSGDRLQLLNTGSTAYVSSSGSNTVISNGGALNVTLTGVAVPALDLFTNVTGVETVSFEGVGSAGTRSLGGAPVLFDGLVHVRNLIGSNHGDVLLGDQGANSLTGGAGADTLAGYGGSDVFDGGAGVDTVSYGWSNFGISSDLSTGRDGAGSTLAAIENLTGSVFADTLTGNAAVNRLDGGFGNDRLDGGGGSDTLVGGDGADLFILRRGQINGVTISDFRGDGNGGADRLRFFGEWNSVDLTNVGDLWTVNYGDGTETFRLTGVTSLAEADMIFDVDRVVSTALSMYQLGPGQSTLIYTGTSNFTGIGNSGNNVITSGAGNDMVDGGAGADTLTGGAGNDVYIIDHASDRVVELSGGGLDTVRTTLSSRSLEAEVEDLLYLGNGSFSGVGNALANRITGGAGNDTLDGGAGADTLTGGAGDDNYVIDNAGDQIVENADGGIDRVSTSLATYTLGTHLERLIYIGSGAIAATGNALDNQLIGGLGNDTLRGLNGNDLLIGAGGTNVLEGGAGDDTYVVDTGDTVIELAGQGSDTVETLLASYTLGEQVENLTYTGSGAFSGTGNSLANRLIGGAGADLLNGGAGADWMQGGAGNDIYVVDNTNDTTVEAWNGGTDTIRTTLSVFTLGENLENLTYIGTGTFSGYGNSVANRIEGGAGADTLDGRGGGDTMIGGAGNDTYIVESTAAVVTETGGTTNGIDTVFTTLRSYTLSFNVENLTYAGNADFTGTGTSVANILIGGSGTDILEGMGGADEIHGGLGVDTASYRNSSSAVSVNLATGAASGGDASGDFLDSIENLIGSAYADTLIGDANANRLEGDAGNDTLRSGGGNDVLLGGRGNDTAVFDGAFANYQIERDGEQITVRDLLTGAESELSSVEYLRFSDGTIAGVTRTVQDGRVLDWFDGAASDDAFMSFDGIDYSYGGGAGEDMFLGGADIDVLYQQTGPDTEKYYGGAGDDVAWVNFANAASTPEANLTFYGGAGTDTLYIYNAATTPRFDRIAVDEYLLWQPNGAWVKLKGVERLGRNNGIVSTLSTTALVKAAGQSITGTGNPDYIRAAAGGTVDVAVGGMGDIVELDIGTGLQSLQFAGVWNDLTVVTGGVSTRILGAERLILGNSSLDRLELNLEGRTIRQNTSLIFLGDTLALGNGSYTGQIRGWTGKDVLVSMDILHAMDGGAGDDRLVIMGSVTAAGTQVIQGGTGEDVLDVSLATFSSSTVLSAMLQNVAGVERFVGSRSVPAFSQLPWMTHVDGGAGGNVIGMSTDGSVMGGLRNDTIHAMSGSTEVIYRRGDGYDLLNNNNNSATDNDVVSFASDIDPSQLRFSYDTSGRLVIEIIGTEGLFRIDGWTTGDARRVDWIRAGGLEIDAAGVDALVAAWATIQPYALGETELRYADQRALAPHLLQHWRPIARATPELEALRVASDSDDLYEVHDVSDVVSETADGGIDRVHSTISYALDDNVEQLTLMGESSLSGTGNALGNWIAGNAGRNLLSGLAGDDVLIGNEGADELAGGAGRDHLHGGTGDDVYVFERGDGADSFAEMGAEGDQDELRFGTDIDSEQLWFGRTGDDLEIRVAGTDDSISIRDWYVDPAARVEQFRFADGEVLLDSQVDALVSAMAAFAPPAAAQTLPPQYQHHGLSGMIAANYQ